MAVIHCPSCGKPNPDFIDVCQYCDEPLKEGVAAPTRAPAEEPAAGPAIPDWLKGDAGADLAAAPAEPAAPGPKDEPDWKWTGVDDAGAGAAPSEPAAPVVPDWMRGDVGTDLAPTPAAPEPAAAEVPDWLKGAGAFESAPAAPEAAPAEELPAWMSGTAGADTVSAPEAAPAQPAEEPPAWMSGGETADFVSAPTEPAPAAEVVPDWMASMRAATAPPEAPAPAFTPPPAEETPDWMASLRGAATPEAPTFAPPSEEAPAWASAPAPADSGAPDWLSGLGAAPATPAESAPSPPSVPADSGAPDWMQGPGAPAAAEETPDWLAGLGGAPATPPSTPATSPFTAPIADAGEPDWLSSLASAPAAPAEAPSPFPPPAVEETPSWMQDLGGSAPAPGGQPDWLAGLGGAPAPPAPGGTAPFTTPPVESNLPDWMQGLTGAPTAPAPSGEPDWLAPAAGAAAASLFAAESPAAPAPAAPSPAPSSAALPDWLAAMRPKDIGAAASVPVSIPVQAPAPSPAPTLRPATPVPEGAVAPTALPSWLQAMRPVDVAAPIMPAEKDTYEETVGVLAGMRGVLRAEPVVTLPTRTAVRVHQVEVSQPQAAAAEILDTLLKEEAEAAPASRRRLRIALPLDRLLVVTLLALVVIAVPIVAPGLFPLPATIAPETRAAFDLIESAPLDRPVLVAFDYDAAQLGELNPAAETLVGHLMRRGVPILAVSTRAAGAPIADSELRRYAAEHGYEYGVNYLNLGYVPGGPVGLLQFAANPRSLFATDFSGQAGVWQLPLAQHVSGLGDFGLIVLISATPDSARAWIEQTPKYASGVRVVAAVSAGAAPLVRPYYESEPHQISALLSGIIGAAQYEQQAGVPGAASARWNAMNGGLITAAALIAAGGLANGLLGLLRRWRRPRRRRK